MIDKVFTNSTFAYEVSALDIDQFLKECEDLGFVCRYSNQYGKVIIRYKLKGV